MLLQQPQRMDLGGGVGVAVVGAHHQAIVVHVLDDVLQVVVHLGGDPDVVVGEDALLELPAAPFHPAPEVVDEVGQPAGAQLDDAPAQLGEAVGKVRHDQQVERAESHELVALVAAQGPSPYTVHVRAVGARVDAHGHVEVAGFVVEREEVGVVDEPVAVVEPGDVHRHRAMVPGETHLPARLRDVAQRRHAGPAEPAAAA